MYSNGHTLRTLFFQIQNHLLLNLGMRKSKQFLEKKDPDESVKQPSKPRKSKRSREQDEEDQPPKKKDKKEKKEKKRKTAK